MTEENKAQEPRLPNINPETYQALIQLDGFVSKASLTRLEHAQSSRCIEHIAAHIERLEEINRKLAQEEAARQKKGVIEDEVCNPAIEQAFNKKK